MYNSHYGFTTKPFQIVPNPDFLYLSHRYENALTYLEYGLMEKVGFILLTGEVGSGKTTLIKHLLRQIESQFEVAVVFNTNVSPGELVGMILSEFELGPASGGKSGALDALNRFLIDCYAKDRRVLLIVDEAQNLSKEALEEIRMLSNLQADDQMLLQIILVGQPEIRERLKARDMTQLNQRISVAYHLPALTREETGAYIAHRLEKAGGRPDLFTTKAVDLIHKASGGIPRTINILCDSALVYGFADELQIIDTLVVEQVITDRDGMGLGMCPQEDKTPDAPPQPEHAGAVVMGRLEALETRLEALQSLVEGQMAALQTRSDSDREELVRKMKDLYAQERKKNDKLIFEYSRLKEKYLALQAEKERLESEEKPEDQSDMIAMLKESIAHVQRENRRLKESYNALYDTYQGLIESKPREVKLQEVKHHKKKH
ncbi:MAG TPA: XrtA-associated ATPase [Deltaproteobacteria bacterium]|jgi:putative secretion ATPase (PEP-CTERM system associated)|nr:XrtA-associated ATPase [Deltaproteobacteria bacterium]HOI08515.1 XrtA-associated ATPase [Deltaproteobacteria bacterium]